MRLIALRSFSGPYGAPVLGQTIEVPDEYGESLIAANFAKPADEPEDKSKKASRRKAAAEPKTETAVDAGEVETATEE